MAQVLIDEQNLTNVADAIREKNDSTDTYTIIEMADAIRDIVGGGGDSVPIGVMVPYSSSKPPVNWLICDGSEVSRTEYADLFKVIGTNYGNGNGTTTFNLPNKKGRVSVGMGSITDGNGTTADFTPIGSKGGEISHKLIINEIPSHSHASDITNTTSSVKDGYVMTGGYTKTGSVDIKAAGGSQPHNNIQPFEVDCWIIKATKSDIQGDPVPIGTEVDYDGEEVPYGWEEVKTAYDYPTTETFTGRYWIDGKKIYKKTFVATWQNDGDFQISHGLTNYIIINIDGVVRNKASNATFLLNSNRPVYSDYAFGFYVSSSVIYFETSTQRSKDYEVYVTLEYIKTNE